MVHRNFRHIPCRGKASCPVLLLHFETACVDSLPKGVVGIIGGISVGKRKIGISVESVKSTGIGVVNADPNLLAGSALQDRDRRWEALWRQGSALGSALSQGIGVGKRCQCQELALGKVWDY